ncbi:MAG: ATP-binding protein [Aeromicrobium sp.]
MPKRGQIVPLAVVGALAGLGTIVCGLILLPVLPTAVGWSLPFLAAYAAGLYACRARPDNLASRRLLLFGTTAVGWLAACDVFLLAVDAYGVRPWFAMANGVVQVAGLLMASSLAAMLVVYPDGVVRGRIQRLVAPALVVVSLATPLALLLSRQQVVPAWVLEWSADVGSLEVKAPASPLAVDALSWLGAGSFFVMDAALGLIPAVGVAVLAIRYRGLDRDQRERLAWPLLVGLLLVVLSVDDLFITFSGPLRVVMDLLEAGALVLLPVSLGIGIARPHLFDAVGTLRRAVMYVALWIVVIGLYVGVAWMLGVTVGQDNLQVAVVVSVLATLGLDPLRRIMVRRVARLAYGEDVPRDELLRQLGDTLEHTMDRGQLTAAIASTAREGLGVRWVRVEIYGAAPVWDGNPSDDEPEVSVRLRHGDADVGRIVCGPSLRGRMTPQRRSLLDTLARQAALALTNARLVGELEVHLHELEASRERLVNAEESARRQLQRDLHDGSQQEIAALLTRIALARNQLRRDDPSGLARTLDTLQGDAVHALQNLREIASGIHASVLADRGLVEAIETRVARLPLRVVVTCGQGFGDGELSDPVEGAAYFFVCEALANTLKHGGAEQATVELGLESGMLHIVVSDDGCGFDPSTVASVGGLAGLADRLAALGGSLEVESQPGNGTRLSAVVTATTLVER